MLIISCGNDRSKGVRLKLNLKIKIGKAEFKNPVFTASGTFGYGEEYADVFDISKLGAVITKGLTLKEREGNEGLRIHEVPCGLINRIGLQNVGVDDFIKEKTHFLKEQNAAVIANVAGFSENEFYSIIRKLEGQDIIKGYEINVSCPNVKKGGIEFSNDKTLFKNLLKTLRKETKKILIVKLSPSAGNIINFAGIAQDEGCNAVTVANTFKSAVIDTRKQKIKIRGGLSGPAVFPAVLNLVLEIKKAVKIPVIASGGIYNPDTAIQFLLAGATAVQIGTANFIDPMISISIIDGIKKYMQEQKINDINSIIGKVKI
ncbi:MAG: dihydroorotate dehydrogenase [Spirochaetes bacterium]|nr:dihydroorotate dehydrogenase [Spirochaetota bacterium]